MENNKTTLEQSQKTLLQFLLAKKKPILIITFLVAIGATIASLLMTPLYLKNMQKTHLVYQRIILPILRMR